MNINQQYNMHLSVSVLEQLQCAYDIVADVLRHAPQLYATRLDHALLVLSLSMELARTSPALLPHSRWHQEEFNL
jgi:hypothetical protein